MENAPHLILIHLTTQYLGFECEQTLSSLHLMDSDNAVQAMDNSKFQEMRWIWGSKKLRERRGGRDHCTPSFSDLENHGLLER